MESKMPSSASECPCASPSISSAKLKSSPLYMRTPLGRFLRMEISLSLSRSEIFMPSTLEELRDKTSRLTWNCAHLANFRKLDQIRRVNILLGLNTPSALTPLELLGESELL